MTTINYTENKNIINDILESRKDLPLKIKIFKCVVFKNTDPNLNEDMIKDIIHKRNKSHGLDGSVIIKLPKGFDIGENNEPEEIKNIENIKYKKKKVYKIKKLKGSKSTAVL